MEKNIPFPQKIFRVHLAYHLKVQLYGYFVSVILTTRYHVLIPPIRKWGENYSCKKRNILTDKKRKILKVVSAAIQ